MFKKAKIRTFETEADAAQEVLNGNADGMVYDKPYNAIFFAENPSGGYYVVYDPTFGTEVNNNYDSGTTPDSDSGHAVTVTSNPNRYSLTTWSGTLTLKSEASLGDGG